MDGVHKLLDRHSFGSVYSCSYTEDSVFESKLTMKKEVDPDGIGFEGQTFYTGFERKE